MLDITLLVLLILLVSFILVLMIRNTSNSIQNKKSFLEIEKNILQLQKSTKDDFQRNRQEIAESIQANRKELNETLQKNRSELSNSFFSFEKKYSQNMKDLNTVIDLQFQNFGTLQRDQNHKTLQSIQPLTDTISNQLKIIREDNSKQLNEMRQTVDEKLQTTLEKRLGESFKIVSERLEAVHKGLGEMQNLATDVGSLKKVLSNVKTRGILGEYQLENILEEILAPHQYRKNVEVKKGSDKRIEFVVKLPGQSSDQEVLLPIDSKFPIESYTLLLDAYDTADRIQVEVRKKEFFKAIDGFAKDISEKYIDPPYTTDFGIMFLPIEGLFAEVVRNTKLFEKLRRKYKITIAGPTTMTVTLNSLRMGFNTLMMNKKSVEVWKVLEGVKFEFKNFSGILDKVDSQLTTASKTLELLKNTRCNAIERKLRAVIDSEDSIQISESKKSTLSI